MIKPIGPGEPAVIPIENKYKILKASMEKHIGRLNGIAEAMKELVQQIDELHK